MTAGVQRSGSAERQLCSRRGWLSSYSVGTHQIPPVSLGFIPSLNFGDVEYTQTGLKTQALMSLMVQYMLLIQQMCMTSSCLRPLVYVDIEFEYWAHPAGNFLISLGIQEVMTKPKGKRSQGHCRGTEPGRVCWTGPSPRLSSQHSRSVSTAIMFGRRNIQKCEVIWSANFSDI